MLLRIGSRGSPVSLLQLGLNRAGFDPGPPDGVFGPLTRASVFRFQRSFGLLQDGIYGPRTEAALAPWLRGYVLHTVRSGDSLYRLSRQYGTTLAAVETANPGLDPFALRIGSSLVIPFAFPVVPTDIPMSSALFAYCAEGLQARYPFLRTEVIGQSVLGRPLTAFEIGWGSRRVLYNAAHHANEYITSVLLLRFLELLCSAYAADLPMEGFSVRELLSLSRLSLVPLVNPDGVDLVTGALEPAQLRAPEAISAAYPAIPFPDGWKANISGVDLNLQYPAGWEQARENKFALGFTSPAPSDFVGTAPLSQPESAAMADFTRRTDPLLTLSYHTQGAVIYWKYLDIEPPGSAELVRRFSAVSGYSAEDVPFSSGFAGYKDWFISEWNRPGFTVEAGRGVNPLPLSQLPEMLRDNLGLLLLALQG